MHQIKPGLRRQDLKGIHFANSIKETLSIRFFESWQTAVKSQGKTITSVSGSLPRFKNKKIESTKFHLFPRKSK
jgi:hypothetical protein